MGSQACMAAWSVQGRAPMCSSSPPGYANRLRITKPSDMLIFSSRMASLPPRPGDRLRNHQPRHRSVQSNCAAPVRKVNSGMCSAATCKATVDSIPSSTQNSPHQMPSAVLRPLTYSSVRDWKYRWLLLAHGCVARYSSSSALLAGALVLSRVIG